MLPKYFLESNISSNLSFENLLWVPFFFWFFEEMCMNRNGFLPAGNGEAMLKAYSAHAPASDPAVGDLLKLVLDEAATRSSLPPQS